MSNTFYKNYDISTINSGEHFAPRPARDPAEIERRRDMRATGALVLEQQQRGIDMTIEMLLAIDDPNEQAKAAQMLGGTLLYTARYLLGLGEQDAMRRTLKLPVIADDTGWRENPDDFQLKLFRTLREASARTEELAEIKRKHRHIGPLERKLGRLIGHGALALSVFPLIRISEDQKALDIQAVVRESALTMHQRAQATSERLGMNISAAHLADTLSPQGIELQTRASDPIAAAYLRASQVTLAA